MIASNRWAGLDWAWNNDAGTIKSFRFKPRILPHQQNLQEYYYVVPLFLYPSNSTSLTSDDEYEALEEEISEDDAAVLTVAKG